ncbi:hypothetical protein CE206_28945 (plasmid) [Achromobacter xylosoxidans]|uniref:hypothetical protein n=1 Tax=Alcaligenes xylosoxydans xylosoxydans TaxID=85698 RepID=UPI000DD15F99|nr:hypothetical protein [Achromobacter xylosoxidans]AXA80606.1 hypothetical protein CE206_28945 [Achromobacter xylosoxidans]
MFQIYYMNSAGGSFLYGEDGDYGTVIDPDNARKWNAERECELVIQDCAERWRVPAVWFRIFRTV